MVCGQLPGPKTFQARAIHHENVGVTITIVVENRYPTAGALEDVFFGFVTPVHHPVPQTGRLSHIKKLNCGGTAYSVCGGAIKDENDRPPHPAFGHPLPQWGRGARGDGTT